MTQLDNDELEYYDSLTVALSNSLPLENFKYYEEYGIQSVSHIKSFFKEHEGCMATLCFDTGRKITEPILGCITEIHQNGVLFTSRCYDPDGNFRQFLGYFVSYIDVYCRTAQVRVFGNI